MLQFFRSPHTAAEFYERYAVERGVIEEFERHLLLVDPAELDFLRDGLLNPARLPIGQACTYPDLQKLSAGGFALLGAPTDSGVSGPPGARWGPAYVRACFPFRPPARVLDLDFRREIDARKVKIHDLGDVQHAIGEPLTHLGNRVTKVVMEVVRRGITPVVLGGDHSVTWFSLRALLDRHPAIGVLHFDAHHDLYWDENRNRRLTHSNPFVFACEHPSLAHLHQIGLRTIEVERAGTRRGIDPRITWVSARELRTMTPAQAFRSAPDTIPYYLSFDVDCLSPVAAPETGTPELGGLDYYQGLELIEYAVRKFRVIGADFVEVATTTGRGANIAAQATARYLMQLLLARAPMTELRSYVQRPLRSGTGSAWCRPSVVSHK